MFDWFKNNPAVTIVVAIFIITIGGFRIYRSVQPAVAEATAWNKVWCYDLSAGKIFVGTEKNAPPFAIEGAKALPDGSPAGVRAEVYSCGSCEDEKERFAAWLWKFTPDVQKAVQLVIDGKPGGFVEDSPYDQGVARGDPNATLIASPDRTGDWVAEPSTRGTQIKAKLKDACKGKPAKNCAPL